MIISRTPFRVSLFGGGTDYPTWYRAHGGSVLGMAIDKYCYITLRSLPPFFDHKHRIVYSKIENVTRLEDIQHPAVRHVLQEYDVTDGVEIHHDGDLPARAGLGSSSSFTVGLINAIEAWRGRMARRQTLAAEAIRIEQNVIGEAVGSQDQVWAAYGGLNRIDFHADDSFTVRPIILPTDRRAELMGRLRLYFTGVSRYAVEVAKKKIANLSAREDHVKTMGQMVDGALDVLNDPDRPLAAIGEMLHEAWQLKRGLADSVTTDDIDAIYDKAMAAGAVGGKLLGAGGGGFILFYVEPDRQAAVDAALDSLVHVDFGIDHSGSRIVVYEPGGLENR